MFGPSALESVPSSSDGKFLTAHTYCALSRKLSSMRAEARGCVRPLCTGERAVQLGWQVSYCTHILCSFLSRKRSSMRAEARGCVSYVPKMFSQSWGHWFVVTRSQSAYTEMHVAVSTASMDDTDQNRLGNISVWHVHIYLHILIWTFTIKTGLHLGSPDIKGTRKPDSR